jgi:hypothetical protein
LLLLRLALPLVLELGQVRLVVLLAVRLLAQELLEALVALLEYWEAQGLLDLVVLDLPQA